MARFNFNSIALNTRADASKINENFNKIESNAVLKTDTATTSANGLMTSAMVTKLNGIATGANKTTVDSSLSSSSTNPVQNKVINTALGNKVDKVDGKQLSTNDYTTAEKNKLAGIEAGANAITVDSNLSGESDNPVKNSTIYNALNNKVDTAQGKGLSTNDYTNEEKQKLDSIDTELLALKNELLQEGLNSEMIGGKTLQDIENDIEAERPFVVGSYTGDGTAERTISLGFTPSAVIVFKTPPRLSNNYMTMSNFGLAINNNPMYGYTNNYPIINIVSHGFKVYYYKDPSLNYYDQDTNDNNKIYNYIAFK